MVTKGVNCGIKWKIKTLSGEEKCECAKKNRKKIYSNHVVNVNVTPVTNGRDAGV